jgi:hypothetical protein
MGTEPADYETHPDGTRVVTRLLADAPAAEPGRATAELKKLCADMDLRLLERARCGDEVAAATLLLMYEDTGRMSSPELQQAVEQGLRSVAGMLARATLGPPTGKSPKVNSLMFFAGLDAKGKRGRKDTHDERFEALVTYDEALTRNDAAGVIASARPFKVHQAQRALVRHIQQASKDISPESCAVCIRIAFPEIDWEDGEADFVIPASWSAIRTE